MEKSSVEVAVAVILNDKKQVLLSKRADHVHQGGLLEFPGGKIEVGELPEEALRRECLEELGISIESCSSFCDISHQYHDKFVRLRVFLVAEYQGVPAGHEGQFVSWSEIECLDAQDFPAANGEIIQQLKSYSKDTPINCSKLE